MEFDWKDGGLGVAIFFDRSVPGGNRGIPRNDACGVFIVPRSCPGYRRAAATLRSGDVSALNVPRSCPGYRRAAATLRSGDVSASTFLHLCLCKSVVAARHLLRHNFRFEGQGKR
jgi:hypothetical protein